MSVTETYKQRLTDVQGNLHRGTAVITKYSDGSEMIRYAFIRQGEPMVCTWTSFGIVENDSAMGEASERSLFPDSLLTSYSGVMQSRETFLISCLGYYQY